jgi:glycerol-3-phosphate acyltransferase PlsY
MIFEVTLSAVTAYLLGSIPFGYLLFRLQRGGDIRAFGSGNIGATNVFRAAGFLAAAATLLLDAGKGYVAVEIASRMAAGSRVAMALAAVLVIVGHCYPIFLKFRGGKGVATALGAFFAISPGAVLGTAALFATVLAAWHYVSLASIAAAGCFPFVLLLVGETSPPFIAASVAGAGLIIARHRANIHRLQAGTESRILGEGKNRTG